MDTNLKHSLGDITMKQSKISCHNVKNFNAYGVNINGKMFLKKEFDTSEAGIECFNKEKEANFKFGKYPWMSHWIQSGENWFVREYYPKECRLDKIAINLSCKEKEEMAVEVLSIVLDLYKEGYAHRDIHGKNFYYIEGQLKLINYDSIVAYVEGCKPTFENCYDLTGKGLKIPFYIGNMRFSNMHPLSISNILGISLEKALLKLKESSLW
ncbi:hypothetical protein EDC18_107113 [Natranaerovirga pectinivora]|uniref:Protein kinase-like protein n=1 Tax=Natranaerovirga pectinivora TaxID=682400 RepID=A0A4R3MJY3_9FIRM|nr:hypothetical protein [Natranaerovirga pectinivora]TCT14044.1 hypothetical protein EDC18_107113 [Natranaerovirga pectinivora]